MLSDNNPIATVGDLEKSKEFYERTRGLTTVMENDEVRLQERSVDTVRIPLAVRRDEQGDGGDLRRRRGR